MRMYYDLWGRIKTARRVVAPYGVRAKTKEADEKWCRLYCVGAGLCSAQSSNYGFIEMFALHYVGNDLCVVPHGYAIFTARHAGRALRKGKANSPINHNLTFSTNKTKTSHSSSVSLCFLFFISFLSFRDY